MLEKGSLTKKFKKVTGGSTATGTYQYDIVSKMKVTTYSPSKINENTDEVTIAGTIKGFDWIADCSVDFQVILGRRP